MKRRVRKPTFEVLLAKRRLAVVNPENGERFVVSLRDWERCLWAVRVIPHERSRCPSNPYDTAHRLIGKEAIEVWLDGLELDSRPQRGLTGPLRDFISKEERAHRRWLQSQIASGRLPSHVKEQM